MERTSLRPPARMALGAALLLLGLALGGLDLLSARPAGAQLPPVAPGGPQSRPLQGTATPTVGPSATPCGGWQVVASADVVTATQNQLQAVAAVAPTDIWAAGYYVTTSGVQQTLTEHWNGTAWNRVDSPNPGPGNNIIYAIVTVAANNVWALGSYFDAGNGQHALALHWNGISWTWVLMDEPPGSTANGIRGAVAVAANDLWAVGFYRDATNLRQTLIERWDGTNWTVVPSPSPGAMDNFLYAVSAVTANDIWAVGYDNDTTCCNDYGPTLTMHWSGTSWTVVPSPNPQPSGLALVSVSARRAYDVLAVGFACQVSPCVEGAPRKTLIEVSNGNAWSVVPSPNPGAYSSVLFAVVDVGLGVGWATGTYSDDGTHWFNLVLGPDGLVPVSSPGTVDNDLRALAKLGPNDIWAVGDQDSGAGLRTQTQHYSGPCVTPTVTPTPTPACGLVWRAVPSPTPATGSNSLSNLTAVAANDIWAVGDSFYYNGTVYTYQTLTEHWNGTNWSIVPSPNEAGSQSFLNGVAAVNTSDVWAVGSSCSNLYSGCGNAPSEQTLTEHWNGSAWSIVPSPNAASHNYLYGVAAVNTSDVWAVGGGWSGQTLIEHWDGNAWSIIPGTPAGTLYAMAVVNSNDVWAVGGAGLILHWNGSSWTVVSSPSAGDLRGVAGVVSDDVWAVGYSGVQTLTLHWDGSAWSIIPSPNPGTSYDRLYGVAAVASNDVWAVGSGRDCFYSCWNPSLIEHWNGSAWSIVPSPEQDIVQGVAAVNSGDIWAVGAGIMRYSDPCPTATPTRTNTPPPTATPPRTNTIAVPPSATRSPTPLPLTATATACPLQFSDVDASNPFYAYIRCLACRGIITGYSTSPPCTAGVPCFLPGALVTRGQTAKFVSNAAGYSDPIASTQQTFSDVPYGSPFWLYIERAYAHGVISGYSSSPPCTTGTPCFLPGNPVTRGQTAKFVSNAANYGDPIPSTQQTFTDVPYGSPFWLYIERAYLHGVINGYSTSPPCTMGVPCFLAGTNVTRGQTAKFIANAFFPACLTPRRP